MRERDLGSVSRPKEDTISKGYSKDVAFGPIHQIEIEVILEGRRI
jgi:hypothetical protein